MTDYPEIKIENKSNNKINNAIYYFWIGFVIYSLSYTIATSGSVSFIICQSLQIFGLLLIVPSVIILIQWKFDNNYLKVIGIIYFCWSFIVIIRGFLFDYQFIKEILFDATFGIFLYFAPLILLFPRNLFYYKKAFGVIVILGITYIIFNLLFLKDLLYPYGDNTRSQAILEYFSQNLSLPSGLLLMTYMYHSKKRRLLALFVIVLTFLLAIIRARRGLMFMSINILIFSYFIYYYAHKVKIIIFLFSLLLILFMYFWGAKIYNENRNGLFAYITERLDEDTRTEVEEYFYQDMNTQDWIIGKGINGQYFCPGIDNNNVTGYRQVIETGFLQIILKGGIISLGLLLFIAIPAIIKGLFYSKNMLSKAAGIWIFLFLIDSYPATLTTFTMNYLLVWISIGICYSNEIRSMSESRIKEIFSTKSN